METNPLLLLGFLSLFHIIGAVAVGSAVRGIAGVVFGEGGGSVAGSLYFVVWGSLFGCMPLAFGLDPNVPRWILPAQLAIWSVSFLVAAVFGRRAVDWLKPLFTLNTGLIVFGGMFMLGGVFGGYAALQGEAPVLTALAIGGVFGVIGLGIFLLGLVNLLRKL
ncbi:MAG: hypothetical protein ACE5G8_05855 [Anaerolineae bacterium]